MITQFANSLAPYLAKFALTVYLAIVSAYAPETVDSRWQGQARWTGQPPVVGQTAACPVAWRGEKVYIETIGVRWCHDTPKDDYIDGKFHFDIYLGSKQEALNHGIRELRVWRFGKEE